MGTRDYSFINGPETPALPTATAPTAASDFVSLSYAQSIASLPTVTGSRASPTNVTTAGITPAGVGVQKIFVQGSGGAIDVTANPQIAAGTTVGQELILIGCSDTNTLKLEHGTGLDLNGDILLQARYVISLTWDGTAWSENYRRQ